MAEKNKSELIYHLVIDENRAHVLSLLLNGYMSILPDDEGMKILLQNFKEEGLVDDFQDLLHEISEKEHELGWCKDPNCKANK